MTNICSSLRRLAFLAGFEVFLLSLSERSLDLALSEVAAFFAVIALAGLSDVHHRCSWRSSYLRLGRFR